MPPTRPARTFGALRAARAAVFALAAVCLAAAAHKAAGGSLPTVGTLGVLAVAVAWCSVVLAARPRGRVVIVAALSIAQLALHEAFMAASVSLCAHATGATAAAMSGMGGNAAAPAATCRAPGATAAMVGMSGHVASAAMVGAHAAATVATGLLLAHGERLVAALPYLLRAYRWPRVGEQIPPALVAPRPTGPDSAPTIGQGSGGAVRRRGPPAGPGRLHPAALTA